MYSIITPESHYKPHHEDVKIVNENNEVCGIIAWWCDNPLASAISEARRTVCLYEDFKVIVKRIVLHKGVPIYTAELHPLRVMEIEKSKNNVRSFRTYESKTR